MKKQTFTDMIEALDFQVELYVRGLSSELKHSTHTSWIVVWFEDEIAGGAA